MGRELNVDVAVVGGSLAGCATGRMLAAAGARVAIAEKHGDLDAFKRLCGHYIQPSAVDAMRRLGLEEPIRTAGAIANGADIHTRWGWIEPRPADDAERRHGYNIRRRRLDPLLRQLAMSTEGVDYLPGTTIVRLLGDRGRCEGAVVRDRAGRETAIRARLVVGADGKASTVANLAEARKREKPNNRFCYLAYHEGVDTRADGRGWIWLLEPDVVIAVPEDDGTTLIAVFPHKSRLAEFKADREGAFRALVGSIPDGDRLRGARRVSPFVGYTDYPVIQRDPVPCDGLALVGDAALTCDPTLAIGCGWALQSAQWLADAVLPALGGAEPLARGLRRYRRVRRRELAGHARMLDAGALAAPANPVERLIMSAATRDGVTARHLERFLGRQMPVRRFLAPTALLRAVSVNAFAGAAR